MVTEKIVPKTVKFLFKGNGQNYSNNGLTFEKNVEVILEANNLPRGFPFTLSELACEAEKVKGMEVTQIG